MNTVASHPAPHTSCAFLFDGAGAAVALDPNAAPAPPETGFLWVHLVREDPSTAPWLEQMQLPPMIEAAITAEDTRPRCTPHGDGAVIILRGVNLNEGARAEDMVSIRLWVTQNCIVSYAQRRLRALEDIQSGATSGHTAHSPGDFLGRLTQRLADRAEPTVSELNEQLDGIEEMILDDGTLPDRSNLGDIRRTAITLRRYMMPQRDALTTLLIEDFTWLSDADLARLREATERITLLSEELDAIRDRAQVVHDQILDKRSETMNRQMFILSSVAAIFLPLGLITGLLGINVGGIPGTENPSAFALVTVGLVAMGGLLVWLFRKWGLL
ncbi:zinc transporter ZntB [Neptunicoccus sediminis]|uniref:zinc transporter ZntB n=1 Tax=Neptunicoccus sediminis TaxID=1892596 RepID=UPI000845E863|nr:zinc transporter ZntB [Neptunicoccus sediminis]